MKLSPIAQLAPLLNGGELVAFNVGPDGLIYLVVALAPLDYQVEQSGWAIFPKTVPEQPQKYHVVALSGGKAIMDVVIEHERFNIHDVQPLGGELLLVCARSHYAGAEGSEKNGRVYTRDGKFIRDILLGDGIQSVQTTADGIIWTGFFDEGIFGNFGWQDPVGASGLVAWDAAGNRLYEFQPTEGLDAICDCYALNVESEEDVWCYYYTQFPLVHLHGRTIEAYWEMPIGGSDAFAISGAHALFRGGYNERDVYHLLSLGDVGAAKSIRKIELRDEEGIPLAAERAVGRADAIYIISRGRLYRVDIQAILAA